MVSARISALVLLASQAAAWTSINCPGSNGNCNYQNQGSVDEAVTMFFQVELASGETEGSFSCSDGDMTYCSRKWAAADSGSAGDCYFLLPAGGQFQCQSQGTIHFLGSHVSPMSGSLLGSSHKSVPCNGGSCTYTNSESTDLWVSQAFEGQGSSRNTFTCTYNNAGATMTVCNYAVNGTGGYSCGYVLPPQTTVTCKVEGSIYMRSSSALVFKQPYLSASAELETKWDCPLVSYPKPNMCDCAYSNPHADKDLVVMVTSSSTNELYNSFHCGFGGANVCAWGSNQNDLGNRGGCYFILPPQTEFSCQMQWGAASFSISTAVAASSTLFGASSSTEFKRPATSEEAVDKKLSQLQHKEMFQRWKAHHQKSYESPMEEEMRFAHFRKHISAFLRHNNETAMPNSLADWSKAEFETYLRDCSKPTPEGAIPRLPKELTITAEDIASIPENVDWRTKGVVTGVKNQAQCGSCWSFSTTGVIEGAWAMAGNKLQSLSEQELVSCDNKDGNSGCDGGWPYLAIQYVQKNGDATEESYPYVSGQGNVPACTAGHTMADVKVSGYYMVNNSEDAMAAAVAKYGPVSIALDAMTQLWWPYTGGIMSGCCNKDVDHAVLIVGYGVTSNGTKYWLIKNSWGTDWGEDGYIRLERGTNQCGITSTPVLAFVEGGQPIPPPTCPPETLVSNNTDGTQTCEWRNNTKGVIIPPPATLSADCSYWPKEGSFSYIWNGNAAPPQNYPCPPSSEHQEQGMGENFCVFYNGAKGLHIPTTATVDCSKLVSEGRFSYTFQP